MRLALIQNHCSPDRDENLGRALDSMEQAKESGADMVVFPEPRVHASTRNAHEAQLAAIPQAGAIDEWPDGPRSGGLRKRLRGLFGAR